jgi:hypothetical protein
VRYPSVRRLIRGVCLDCVGGAREVKGCQGDKGETGSCPFYEYRLGKGRASVKLARKFCLQCMNGHVVMVKECDSKRCPLVPYRMGRSPNVTEEMRQNLNNRALGRGFGAVDRRSRETGM